MQTIIYTGSNPSNLTTFKEQIVGQGYNVIVCNVVIEILVEIEASCVDMIVLDLDLPDVGSDSICRLLKNHSLNDKVGILLVSENKEFSIEASRLPDGADGLLFKPFEVNDLLAKISVIIAKTAGDLKFVQLKKMPMKKPKKKSNSGQFVGRYELLDKLGSGANSIVYRAVDREQPNSEAVAFKMFNQGVYQEIDSSSIDAFFLREAYQNSRNRMIFQFPNFWV